MICFFPSKPVDMNDPNCRKPQMRGKSCLSADAALTGCGLSKSVLLKSVPVSWARIRKERDWVVPVRGCQSSVSSISLFLLRSLGMKQAMFSTRKPCLWIRAFRDLSDFSATQHTTTTWRLTSQVMRTRTKRGLATKNVLYVQIKSLGWMSFLDKNLLWLLFRWPLLLCREKQMGLGHAKHPP